MLGVTTYITTDVASAPFPWVIPLALYPLTFIVAFAAKPWRSPARRHPGAAGRCARRLRCPPAVGHGTNLALVHAAHPPELVLPTTRPLICPQALVARRPGSRAADRILSMDLVRRRGRPGHFNAFLAGGPVIFNNVWEISAGLDTGLPGLIRPWGQGRRSAPTPRAGRPWSSASPPPLAAADRSPQPHQQPLPSANPIFLTIHAGGRQFAEAAAPLAMAAAIVCRLHLIHGRGCWLVLRPDRRSSPWPPKAAGEPHR